VETAVPAGCPASADLASSSQRAHNRAIPGGPGVHLSRVKRADDLSQVAGYKQIRRLEVIEAIPKSPSGKILRRILRGVAAAQAEPPAG